MIQGTECFTPLTDELKLQYGLMDNNENIIQAQSDVQDNIDHNAVLYDNNDTTTSTISQVEVTEPARKKTRKQWTLSQENALINCFKEYKHQFDSNSFKNDAVWRTISEKLHESGHDFDSTQCKYKFANLKHFYTAARDHNAKTGNDRRDFRHEAAFDEIFAISHAIHPVHSVESSSEFEPPQTVSYNTVAGDPAEQTEDVAVTSSAVKKNKRTAGQVLRDYLDSRAEESEKCQEERNAHFKEIMEMEERKRQDSIRATNDVVMAMRESTEVFKQTMEALIKKL